jgi:hypothetical protein
MKRRVRKRFDAGGPVSGGSFGGGFAEGLSSAAQAYQTIKSATKAFGGDANTSGSGSGPRGAGADPWDTSAEGKARGGKIKRVAGKRIGKDDGLIPAQKGEFVVRKAAVKKLGDKAMNTINKGRLPAKRGR